VTKADLEAENAKLKAELAKLHGRSRSPCRADIVADSTPSRRAEALGFVPDISSPNPFLLHGSHRLFGLVALQIGLHTSACVAVRWRSRMFLLQKHAGASEKIRPRHHKKGQD
jgi:hypothetical protein